MPLKKSYNIKIIDHKKVYNQHPRSKKRTFAGYHLKIQKGAKIQHKYLIHNNRKALSKKLRAKGHGRVNTQAAKVKKFYALVKGNPKYKSDNGNFQNLPAPYQGLNGKDRTKVFGVIAKVN